MSWVKKQAPEVTPDLAALRARETELVARQRALEAEHLDTEDIERSNELLAQINDLNAQLAYCVTPLRNFRVKTGGISMAILRENDALYKALMSTEGRAEIIGGEIAEFESAGFIPAHAAMKIRMSLRDYEEQSGNGESLGDFVGFLCDLPNRQSFCADAAFYTGAEPKNPVGFCPNRPFSPSKCAIRKITDATPKPLLPQRSPITSPPERSLYGKLICATKT